MLSSAKKSVPTVKQFVQPYFIQVAPTGAIAAVCDRFNRLLKIGAIHNYLDNNAIDVLLKRGALIPVPNAGFFDPIFSPDSLPSTFDLRVNSAGGSFFTIRWITAPAFDEGENAGGLQLTGVAIYPGETAAIPDPQGKNRTFFLR